MNTRTAKTERRQTNLDKKLEWLAFHLDYFLIPIIMIGFALFVQAISSM